MATKKKAIAGAMACGPDDWQCESDLRTLAEAAAIKRDPKRLAKAQAMAKQKMMDMAQVASAEPGDTDD